MPTSVPIFSFLVRLVSEISGPKIKSGSSWFPQTPPSGQIFIQGLVRVNDYKCAKFQLPSSITEIWKGSQNKNWELLITSDAPLTVKFLHVAIVPTNAYQRTKFQLPSSISFRDKEGVPTFNVRATSPLPYPVRWNFYVRLKYLARSHSAPNFSIVSICIVQLCECISHRLSIICAPKWGFGGRFEGEDVKILSSNPEKALPCMNTRLLMYCVTKSVQRSSRSVEKFCVQRRKK